MRRLKHSVDTRIRQSKDDRYVGAFSPGFRRMYQHLNPKDLLESIEKHMSIGAKATRLASRAKLQFLVSAVFRRIDHRL